MPQRNCIRTVSRDESDCFFQKLLDMDLTKSWGAFLCVVRHQLIKNLFFSGYMKGQKLDNFSGLFLSAVPNQSND